MSSFVVWCPEHHEVFEDGRLFAASTSEAAARAWAARFDSDDCVYEIANEQVTPTVCVVAEGKDQSHAKKYRLTGRMTCVYDATETR